MEEEETRVTRPNSLFLARMLQGNQRGNQREIDTNASLAARKAVGASGAASIRPALVRSARKGPEAVRRAALSAAQEQKLILCTSLLKEVARTFGFRLSVCHGFSTQADTAMGEGGPPATAAAAAAAAAGAAAAPSSEGQMDAKGTTNGDESSGQGEQQAGGRADGSSQDGLQDLKVALKLPAISVDNWADDGEDEEQEGNEWEEEEEEEEGRGGLKRRAKRAAAAAVAPTPRGSAVLARLRARLHSPQQVQKRVRPKLASNALSSLGLALRKAAAPAATTVGEAQHRRLSSVKRDVEAEGKGDATPATDPHSQPTSSLDPKLVIPAPSTMEVSQLPPSAPAAAPTSTPEAPRSPLVTAQFPSVSPDLRPPIQPISSPSLQPTSIPFPSSSLLPDDQVGAEGDSDGAEAKAAGPLKSSKGRRKGRGSRNEGDRQQQGPDEGVSQGIAEGRADAGSTPAQAAAAAAATPASDRASQPQAQAPTKRTPSVMQGLFGAAMRDIKKVKPTAAKPGAGKVEGRKEEEQG